MITYYRLSNNSFEEGHWHFLPAKEQRPHVGLFSSHFFLRVLPDRDLVLIVQVYIDDRAHTRETACLCTQLLPLSNCTHGVYLCRQRPLPLDLRSPVCLSVLDW